MVIRASVSWRGSGCVLFGGFTEAQLQQKCGGASPAAAAASERVKETLKPFNATNGSGFINPHNGGENLFFHQPYIKSDGGDRGGCSASYVENGNLFNEEPVFDEGPVFDEEPLIDIESSNFNSSVLFNCSMNCPSRAVDFMGSAAFGVSSEETALTVFDEMPHSTVVWDDELQHSSDSHDDLLKQLAGCVDYVVDEETKTVVEPCIDDKLPHVSGIHLPLELHIDVVSDVFSEMPPEMVIWDEELSCDLHSYGGLLQQLAMGEEYFGEKTMTVAELTNNNVFKTVNVSSLCLELEVDGTGSVVDEMHIKSEGIDMLEELTHVHDAQLKPATGSVHEHACLFEKTKAVLDKMGQFPVLGTAHMEEIVYKNMVEEVLPTISPLSNKLPNVRVLQVSMDLRIAEAGKEMNDLFFKSIHNRQLEDKFGGNLMTLKRLMGQVKSHIPLGMRNSFSPGSDFSQGSKVKQLVCWDMPPWSHGNFSLGKNVPQRRFSHRMTSRQWDQGILRYVASSTYTICSSFQFLQSLVTLLVPLLQVLYAAYLGDGDGFSHMPPWTRNGFILEAMCTFLVQFALTMKLQLLGSFQGHHLLLIILRIIRHWDPGINSLMRLIMSACVHKFFRGEGKLKMMRRQEYVVQMHGVAWGQATFWRDGNVTPGPWAHHATRPGPRPKSEDSPAWLIMPPGQAHGPSRRTAQQPLYKEAAAPSVEGMEEQKQNRVIPFSRLP